jgi:hypothetical protein
MIDASALKAEEYALAVSIPDFLIFAVKAKGAQCFVKILDQIGHAGFCTGKAQVVGLRIEFKVANFSSFRIK